MRFLRRFSPSARRYTLIHANLYPLSRYIIAFILAIIFFDNRRRVVDVDKFFTTIIKRCRWGIATPKLLFVRIFILQVLNLLLYIMCVSSDHREKLISKQKETQRITEWCYFAIRKHSREGMRGLNVGLCCRTLSSCRSITRPFAKIVRFGGNSEKPSSSYNAGIRFGSVKDEKKEKVR